MLTSGPPNWLWVPVVGIRWTTALMALAILLVVGGLRRRPFLALVTILAWASAYEIVFRAFNLVAHHLDGSLPTELQAWLWQALATVSWPLLAHVRGVRPYQPLVVVCGLAFAVWLWGGFWYDWRGQPYGLLLGDEILNVVTKTGLGVAYLIGALRLAAMLITSPSMPARRRPQRPGPPALIVPRDQALADLERQLAEGSSLREIRTLRTRQELDDFRSRCETWRETTTERLRQMFDRPDEASRFSVAATPVRIFAWPAGGFFGGPLSSWPESQAEFNRLHAALGRGCRMLEGLRDVVREAAADSH